MDVHSHYFFSIVMQGSEIKSSHIGKERGTIDFIDRQYDNSCRKSDGTKPLSLAQSVSVNTWEIHNIVNIHSEYIVTICSCEYTYIHYVYNEQSENQIYKT